jgi:prephenate dehydrogenase
MAAYDSIAIVGVGLIGGSIGLAVRERRLAREVIGIGRRESSLNGARLIGAIDRGTTDLSAGAAVAELIIVCTPVDTIAETVLNAAGACRPNTLITDAGSTKQAVVSTIDAALASRRAGSPFVGSHPLAGDHRGGAEFARPDLFDGRVVVVTPTSASRPAAVVEISGFGDSLGARVMTMSAAEHDEALAATSHVPHLIATALAAATPEKLLPLAASGWRDTTRVAAGDPKLWEPIFTTNRQFVLQALDRFVEKVAGLREALDREDYQQLHRILEKAKNTKRARDALGD